jgi:lipopolysaccharide/colanic/teichoic acid biosynthesis glycosyltransferase
VHFAGIAIVTALCLLGFLGSNLYAVPPPSPPEEIRRSTLCISLVCVSFVVVATLGHLAAFFGIGFLAWGLGWFLAVVLVPMGRAILRTKYARAPFWGSPVVVLGAGKVGRAVVATLRRRPQLGLKPVAILDDDPAKHGTLRAHFGEDDIMVESVRAISLQDRINAEGTTDFESPSMRAVWGQFSEVEGVPIVGGLELAPVLSQRLKIKTAVVAMPEMDSPALLAVIERFGGSFTNVLVIPDLLNLAHFGAPTRDLGGTIGIEVRRQLLLTGPRIAKRAIDIVLTIVGGLMIMPILVALATMVALDSPGGFFYRQKRLGQDGVRFKALKFRTMYGDGEQRLKQVLENDPKMRAEYEEFHKLTFDPRVTRVGRFLRKYSLDELPQLWNVLMGEMSLVGPRPYIDREIPDMIQQEAVILRVKPGMTGIWQVTERNASTFEQRVQLDVEYVRNWSPWLDIYVLARTIPVVIGGTGT